ncbi:unnamed protein product [Gadus morhua 'NCC']
MRLAYQFAGVANQRAGSLGEKDPSVDSRRRSDCTDPLLGRREAGLLHHKEGLVLPGSVTSTVLCTNPGVVHRDTRKQGRPGPSRRLPWSKAMAITHLMSSDVEAIMKLVMTHFPRTTCHHFGVII